MWDVGPRTIADDLVGVDEIAEMIEVERGTARQYTQRDDFPHPDIKSLGSTETGSSWRRGEVEAWRELNFEGETEDDPWDVAIDTSPAARRYIQERGGRVFVWLEPVNEWWVTQKVSTTSPPGGPLFDEFDAEGFTLHLQSDFDPPDGVIRLRLRPWWPFERLSVWTGLERLGKSGYDW